MKPANLKGNQPWSSLEGLTLKLKLQYFGHLIRRANSLEKTLMLGKTEGKRRRVQQRMRCLDNQLITISMDINLNKLQETVKDREAGHAAVHGVAKSGHELAIEQQQQFEKHYSESSTWNFVKCYYYTRGIRFQSLCKHWLPGKDSMRWLACLMSCWKELSAFGLSTFSQFKYGEDSWKRDLCSA